MDSLYGGVPGAPFILKEKFESTEDMKKASVQIVNYGEYCLISTQNLNDPQNGELYQRVYGYSSEDTGEFVLKGRIAGPRSGMPNIEIVSASKIYDKFNAIENKTTISYLGDKDGLKWSDEFQTPVNGKEGQYTDDGVLKYTWLNVSDKNNASTTTYIAVQVPKIIFNTNANMIKWSDSPEASIAEDSNWWNPELTFEIPAQVPTPYFKNVKFETNNTNNQRTLYTSESFKLKQDGVFWELSDDSKLKRTIYPGESYFCGNYCYPAEDGTTIETTIYLGSNTGVSYTKHFRMSQIIPNENTESIEDIAKNKSMKQWLNEATSASGELSYSPNGFWVKNDNNEWEASDPTNKSNWKISGVITVEDDMNLTNENDRGKIILFTYNETKKWESFQEVIITTSLQESITSANNLFGKWG